jgi:hypothetical protein
VEIESVATYTTLSYSISELKYGQYKAKIGGKCYNICISPEKVRRGKMARNG